MKTNAQIIDIYKNRGNMTTEEYNLFLEEKQYTEEEVDDIVKSLTRLGYIK